MRKKIVAGNWKMNLGWSKAAELMDELNKAYPSWPGDVEVIIAPPAPYLSGMILQISPMMALAIQNASEYENGAYTGEVSMEMLRSMGIGYCILGHSERRSLFQETDEIIGAKVKKAIDKRVNPIFCCGERLEEREAGKHFETVKKQIVQGVFHLDQFDVAQVIVAYEPVWAIGTGVTASSEQAQEMHAFIRQLFKEKYNAQVADNLSILYGGSCKPENARELFACPDVDGGLIGGASLQSTDFSAIIKAMGV